MKGYGEFSILFIFVSMHGDILVMSPLEPVADPGILVTSF